MTTNIQSILTIPTIQDAIGRRMKLRDLERCQNVNRDWREIFSPLLWRERLLELRREKEFYENDDVSQAILKKFGSHIRRLWIQEIRCLEVIAPRCHRITHLFVEERRHGNVGNPATTAPSPGVDQPLELSHLPGVDQPSELSPSPGVDRPLELSSSPPNDSNIHSRAHIGPGQLVPLLSQHPLSQSLRVLTFHYHGLEVGSTSLVLDLLLALPHLILLDCQLGKRWQVDHDDDLLRRSTFRLKTLRISYEKDGCVKDPGVILPFWRQCHFLTTFDLTWMTEQDAVSEFVAMFDIRDGANQPIRPIEGLTMPATLPVEDWQLIRILRGCAGQQLTYLFVPTWPFGPAAFEVLLEARFTDLAHLVISDKVVHHDVAPEAWTKRLLAACPRLKSLPLENPAPGDPTCLHFHAYDKLSMPLCPIGACFFKQLSRKPL
ncbi:hypothetical protein DFQ26_004351 [Actinomortierella ambigua]|nr:hypothetical protein DFQ26_004351 [Actinomortierella ambigua]